MKISLEGVSKKFNSSWVIKNFDFEFNEGISYGIAGRNGVGKSTLMQLIGGMIRPNKGKVHWVVNGKETREHIEPLICMAAPYMDLPSYFTINELLDFHFTFKSYIDNISSRDFWDLTDLKSHQRKTILELSSGLYQRLKLALAILSEGEVLLLDEPTTNLDSEARKWFSKLLHDFAKNRTVIIASNDEQDFFHTQIKIELKQYMKV